MNESIVKKFLGMGEPDPMVLKRAEEAFHRDAPVVDGQLLRQDYLVDGALRVPN